MGVLGIPPHKSALADVATENQIHSTPTREWHPWDPVPVSQAGLQFHSEGSAPGIHELEELETARWNGADQLPFPCRPNVDLNLEGIPALHP